MHKYLVAEKFRSIQGEGVYAGTPMAFIRFVGCSVGKKICTHCDTTFERVLPWQGGGEFSAEELMLWVDDYQHICLTGGEPLDQNLSPLFEEADCREWDGMWHVETSGTKPLWGLKANPRAAQREDGLWMHPLVWLCVSPKPGWREDMIDLADEVKVIVPGLGDKLPTHGPDALAQANFRWPTPQDALRWAEEGKIVFLQPRNGRFDIDRQNLLYCQDFIREHPQLRLSVQLHKLLHVQ